MKIICNIRGIESGKANCEVKMVTERFDNELMTGLYDAMQFASILRAMRDHNKKSFNAAMEQFIEEELSNE